MKKWIVLLFIATTLLFAAPKPPYPIIFVHGLVGSDESFEETMQFLNGELDGYPSDYDWGSINSYDVVLNFDNSNANSILENDVRWYNSEFDGKNIKLGRRRYDYSSYDWDSNSNIFAINFQEERIKDALGWFNDIFDHGNEAAIYKQGYALGKMIGEVLAFTGASKVILVAHSMGGLAIREYLQRTIDGTDSTNHKWWVNPSDNINGHKVARVVTIGTPHLGSNSGFDPSNSKTNSLKSVKPPNIWSEAMRDLKYLYDTEEWGIYLYGGVESSLSLNDFHNRDVNCDGNLNSDITGLNQNDPYACYNNNMPLPPNIRYTWIASNSFDGENPANWLNPIPQDDGDGCVLYICQYLWDESGLIKPYNVADTLNVSLEHDDECDAYKSIIKGLDEPDTKELAYEIKDGIEYSGTISRITNNNPEDIDLYKLSNSYPGVITLNIKPNSSGANAFYIYENDNGTMEQVYFSLFVGEINYSYTLIYNSDIYIGIKGSALLGSYNSPYSFSVDMDQIVTVFGPPTNLQVAYNGNIAYLDWDVISGAEKYYIYGMTDPYGSRTLLDSTSSTMFTYPTAGNKYFFGVSSKNSTPPAPAGFVYVQGGTFTMGDHFSEGDSDELPLHSVTLSGFYMGATEVTQGEWAQYMPPAYEYWGVTSYDYGSGSNYPVYYTRWYAIIKYCNLRSMAEGLNPVYSIKGSTDPAVWGEVPYDWNTDWNAAICNWSANGYRLPTEAEWEYAARGGISGQRFPNGATISHSTNGDTHANYYAYPSSYSYDVSPTTGYHPDYYETSSPVGSFPPNGYGLYDMAGNLWE